MIWNLIRRVSSKSDGALFPAERSPASRLPGALAERLASRGRFTGLTATPPPSSLSRLLARVFSSSLRTPPPSPAAPRPPCGARTLFSDHGGSPGRLGLRKRCTEGRSSPPSSPVLGPTGLEATCFSSKPFGKGPLISQFGLDI